MVVITERKVITIPEIHGMGALVRSRLKQKFNLLAIVTHMPCLYCNSNNKAVLKVTR